MLIIEDYILGTTCKEMTMAYFKIVSENSPERNVGNHEKSE